MPGWSCSSTEWGFSKGLVYNLTRWTGLLSWELQKTDYMAKGCRHQEQDMNLLLSHLHCFKTRHQQSYRQRHSQPSCLSAHFSSDQDPEPSPLEHLLRWHRITPPPTTPPVVHSRSSDDLLHVLDDPKFTSHSVVHVQVMTWSGSCWIWWVLKDGGVVCLPSVFFIQ